MRNFQKHFLHRGKRYEVILASAYGEMTIMRARAFEIFFQAAWGKSTIGFATKSIVWRGRRVYLLGLRASPEYRRACLKELYGSDAMMDFGNFQEHAHRVPKVLINAAEHRRKTK
jgi:hypothetical protein